ncbi:MAG: hypothetical protein ACP5NY_01325 [Thermocladium sp.]
MEVSFITEEDGRSHGGFYNIVRYIFALTASWVYSLGTGNKRL